MWGDSVDDPSILDQRYILASIMLCPREILDINLKVLQYLAKPELGLIKGRGADMYLSKATRNKVINFVEHQLLKRFAQKFERSDFKIDE